ncbi:glucose-1-phosphate adenylyltransferase subunit GlgD [Oceanobacillus alkalisoli]|uniref:glucose-1-phosphate adenylyltransferase subunit GlgD n=1 Tax=Oceanobacillus alkalisoli TaxID=2925113 RepID=UPI001EE42004|nr:glucose-1-phosphate adenylyltransferase subunit GlgD [Oceanobacillus alkalisoli]MCG5104875.1 glucose-1-phosphate adenylyltransferase subunit GlgD [Oceanobacillus alkalisoli]
MDRMMGLINLDQEYHVFNELTYFRNNASIPFAGRYRLIDFALSNMTSSGMEEVAIFVRHKYRSLLDHLGSGESWDLDRRHGGLFILPPDWNDPSDRSRGDLSFFHNNRDYFNRGKTNHVLVSGSQFIVNTDYKEAFNQHIEMDADVTVVYTPVAEVRPEHQAYFRIEKGEDSKVLNITNDHRNFNVFTGVYIIKKDLLMDVVDYCIAYHNENLFADGIKDRIGELDVRAYKYDGYHAFINTIESYYRENMKLLTEENFINLFAKPFIRTKASSNPPVKYQSQAVVHNSIIANGCSVNGQVENSILFRGVEVSEHSTIKHSIIMQRCTIEEDVYLENVILDKDVHVKKGQRMIGTTDKPYVVAKRQIV